MMMWDGGPMSDNAEGPPPARVPFEQPVDRIPSPEDQEHIRHLVEWADLIHQQAHQPWGVMWLVLQQSVKGLRPLLEWAEHAQVDSRYRYRVDKPMDAEEELKKLGDTIPDDWKL
jgi:hypothetical protein